MDQLGLDAGYRERTHCTLYTLELHMHFLHEIKASDELTVTTRVLGRRPQAHSRGLRLPLPAPRRARRDGRDDAAARASGREACERAPFRPRFSPGSKASSCPNPHSRSAAWARSRKIEIKRR